MVQTTSVEGKRSGSMAGAHKQRRGGGRVETCGALLHVGGGQAVAVRPVAVVAGVGQARFDAAGDLLAGQR